LLQHAGVYYGVIRKKSIRTRFHGMAESSSRLDVRPIVCVAGDVLRFVSSMLRPHAQFAAENLFLRKQLGLLRMSPLEQSIDQAGELVRHRGDGLWGAEFAAEAAVLST
jgi:hypothetical protein